MRKSKPKNHNPRLGLCYSEILTSAQNNGFVSARKPSLVLCASLNSKTSLYMVLCSSFILCYIFSFLFFFPVQQLVGGDRILEGKCYTQYITQSVQSSSCQSWVLRLYISTHDFHVTSKQLRTRSFGLLFNKKKKVKYVWRRPR